MAQAHLMGKRPSSTLSSLQAEQSLSVLGATTRRPPRGCSVSPPLHQSSAQSLAQSCARACTFLPTATPSALCLFRRSARAGAVFKPGLTDNARLALYSKWFWPSGDQSKQSIKVTLACLCGGYAFIILFMRSAEAEIGRAATRLDVALEPIGLVVAGLLVDIIDAETS